MNHHFLKTAVAFIVLLFTVAACGRSASEAEAPEFTNPTFILFYTDN